MTFAMLGNKNNFFAHAAHMTSPVLYTTARYLCFRSHETNFLEPERDLASADSASAGLSFSAVSLCCSLACLCSSPDSTRQSLGLLSAVVWPLDHCPTVWAERLGLLIAPRLFPKHGGLLLFKGDTMTTQAILTVTEN